MDAPRDPSSVDYDFDRAERFYTKLRSRVSGWLAGKAKVGDRVRRYLLLVPDLFALLIRLIRDPRVDRGLKIQLMAVSAYVISPIDLVPDFLLPFGLVDDAVALALVLNRAVRLMDESGEAILREHWEGEGDALDQIRQLLGTADTVLGPRVLKRLRKLFS